MKEEIYEMNIPPCHAHAWIHKIFYEKDMRKAMNKLEYRLFYYRNRIQVFDEAGTYLLPLYRIAKIKPSRKGLRITTAKDKKCYTCAMSIDTFIQAYQKDYSLYQVRRKLFVNMRYYSSDKETADTLIIDGEGISVSLWYRKNFRGNAAIIKHIYAYM